MAELEERWAEVKRAYGGDLQCVDTMVRLQPCQIHVPCLNTSTHPYSHDLLCVDTWWDTGPCQMHAPLCPSTNAFSAAPSGECQKWDSATIRRFT